MTAPELTPHERYTVSQLKALLKQWPKSLALLVDAPGKTIAVCKRDPDQPNHATEVATFRKPTAVLHVD